MKEVSQEFIGQAIFRMNENTERIERCLLRLTDQELWQAPNEQSNSIGNLILHLSGNIRQYLISALGGEVDHRKRDEEFNASGDLQKTELLQKLSATVTEGIHSIEQLDDSMLLHRRKIQGFDLTGIGAILHVVEHYSYHTGQIALWTKILKNEDLGFYGNMDLNQRNDTSFNA